MARCKSEWDVDVPFAPLRVFLAFPRGAVHRTRPVRSSIALRVDTRTGKVLLRALFAQGRCYGLKHGRERYRAGLPHGSAAAARTARSTLGPLRAASKPLHARRGLFRERIGRRGAEQARAHRDVSANLLAPAPTGRVAAAVCLVGATSSRAAHGQPAAPSWSTTTAETPRRCRDGLQVSRSSDSAPTPCAAGGVWVGGGRHLPLHDRV